MYDRFTSTIKLPRQGPDRNAGQYLSLREACKIIDIDPKTYRMKEGKLFPKAKRLPNRSRVFTLEDVETLSKVWRQRGRYR